MNRALVLRLIIKDWYLSRTTLAILAVAGGLSIGLLYVRGGDAGLTGLITSLMTAIFLSILLPMGTVVQERKMQNLAFVMSLPISPMEYTAAKVLGNLAAFLVLWLAITIGVLGTFARAGLGGSIPLALVAAMAPFVAFCLLLAVSIVVESEMAALVTMGACNVAYSFWYFLLRIPGLKEDLQSPVAIWSQPILLILAGQIAVIVGALGLTFYLQSRKTDFI